MQDETRRDQTTSNPLVVMFLCIALLGALIYYGSRASSQSKATLQSEENISQSHLIR